MSAEENKGGIKTHFVDAIVPTDKSLGGDWGGTKNGADIQGGQKGTAGKIPEVTFVDIQGAPKPGSSATAGSQGKVANKGPKDVGGY